MRTKCTHSRRSHRNRKHITFCNGDLRPQREICKWKKFKWNLDIKQNSYGSIYMIFKFVPSFHITEPHSVAPVLFVDLVSEANRVNDGELKAYVALLQLIRVGLELHSRLVVLIRLALKLGVEQSVHESGLSQTGLP